MKKINTFLCAALIVITVISVFVVSADLIITKSTSAYIFNELNDVPHHSVGVVLGTSKTNGRGYPNLYFKYRIKAVCDLYNAQKIDYVLVSGDNGHSTYNEPEDFKEELIKNGVPEEKIYLDYAGFRTYDSMIRAHKVFGLKSFVVISQKFHNERAVYIARRLHIDAIAFNAKDVEGRYGLKTKLREKLARVKVFIDLLFNKKPHFLGDPISIP